MDALSAASSSLLSPASALRQLRAGRVSAGATSPLLSMSRTSALKILLVDHQLEVAEKLRHHLLTSQQESSDSEIKCSQHGLEAMVIAEGFQPHLVVIEVGWPRRSGTCTAKLLRDRPWARQLVIVSHSHDDNQSFEPTEHFDFHFFDGIDTEMLMQLYSNLARRRCIQRDVELGSMVASQLRVHTKH